MRIENLGQQPQRILTQRAERILDVPARLLARTGDRPLNQHRRPLVDAIGMKRVVTRRQWADEILRFELFEADGTSRLFVVERCRSTRLTNRNLGFGDDARFEVDNFIAVRGGAGLLRSVGRCHIAGVVVFDEILITDLAELFHQCFRTTTGFLWIG